MPQVLGNDADRRVYRRTIGYRENLAVLSIVEGGAQAAVGRTRRAAGHRWPVSRLHVFSTELCMIPTGKIIACTPSPSRVFFDLTKEPKMVILIAKGVTPLWSAEAGNRRILYRV